MCLHNYFSSPLFFLLSTTLPAPIIHFARHAVNVCSEYLGIYIAYFECLRDLVQAAAENPARLLDYASWRARWNILSENVQRAPPYTDGHVQRSSFRLTGLNSGTALLFGNEHMALHHLVIGALTPAVIPDDVVSPVLASALNDAYAASAAAAAAAGDVELPYTPAPALGAFLPLRYALICGGEYIALMYSIGRGPTRISRATPEGRANRRKMQLSIDIWFGVTIPLLAAFQPSAFDKMPKAHTPRHALDTMDAYNGLLNVRISSIYY